MFGATFNLFTSDTTLNFGTLNDGSQDINSLAWNDWFSYRNVFQNGVNVLSKMAFKIVIFVQKLK